LLGGSYAVLYDDRAYWPAPAASAVAVAPAQGPTQAKHTAL